MLHVLEIIALFLQFKPRKLKLILHPKDVGGSQCDQNWSLHRFLFRSYLGAMNTPACRYAKCQNLKVWIPEYGRLMPKCWQFLHPRFNVPNDLNGKGYNAMGIGNPKCWNSHLWHLANTISTLAFLPPLMSLPEVNFKDVKHHHLNDKHHYY